MSLIAYAIQSYKREDLPRITLKNLFVEKVPAQSVKSQVTLLPRPGLVRYYEIGSGPINGMGILNDTLISVSNQEVYADQALIGSLDNSGRVQMALAVDTMLIATGPSLYTATETAVSAVAFPDGAGVTSVAYLGGYCFAVRTDSRRVYFTLDPDTWDGADFVSANQAPGNVVGLAVVSDQLWVFCDRVTQVFMLTGNSDAPIQPLSGRVFPKGCLSRESIVPMDNSVLWVGNDAVVYRGGDTPDRISDHGIEEAIADGAGDTTINAWSFQWYGHLFYALSTNRGTMVYDAATQQWTEFASYQRTNWRARAGFTVTSDAILVGDDETGTIWVLGDRFYQDDGQPIQTEFSAFVEQSGFIDNVIVDCSTGQTGGASIAPGLIEMRTSRDSGVTWDDWRDDTLGADGAARTMVNFRSLGLVDQSGLLMQFRITDDRPRRISYLAVNEPIAGRSR